MTRRNFEQALRALVGAHPFRPFLVELVSGSRFQVEHPEALAMAGGIAVYISPDGTPTIFDSEGVSQLVANQSRLRRSP